jgi:hypothetical protein
MSKLKQAITLGSAALLVTGAAMAEFVNEMNFSIDMTPVTQDLNGNVIADCPTGAGNCETMDGSGDGLLQRRVFDPDTSRYYLQTLLVEGANFKSEQITRMGINGLQNDNADLAQKVVFSSQGYTQDTALLMGPNFVTTATNANGGTMPDPELFINDTIGVSAGGTQTLRIHGEPGGGGIGVNDMWTVRVDVTGAQADIGDFIYGTSTRTSKNGVDITPTGGDSLDLDTRQLTVIGLTTDNAGLFLAGPSSSGAVPSIFSYQRFAEMTGGTRVYGNVANPSFGGIITASVFNDALAGYPTPENWGVGDTATALYGNDAYGDTTFWGVRSSGGVSVMNDPTNW